MDYPNLILKVRSGSFAYGTQLPTSDEDIRGVVIPEIDNFLGLKDFQQYESPEGSEEDVCYFGIKKYIALACKGNLSALNFLFVRKKDILYVDEYGQRLIDFRKNFLTNNVIDCIIGYTKSQIHRMQKGSGRCGARQEIVETYGYDVKFAMHSVMITNVAVELLKSGNYHVYRPDMEQKVLKGIRTGQYTYEQVMKMVEENLTVIKTLEPISTLPEKPDMELVNNFTVSLLKDYFKKDICN